MTGRFEGLGFLKGSNGQIVILRCLCCGNYLRVSWDDYAAGKYD